MISNQRKIQHRALRSTLGFIVQAGLIRFSWLSSARINRRDFRPSTELPDNQPWPWIELSLYTDAPSPQEKIVSLSPLTILYRVEEASVHRLIELRTNVIMTYKYPWIIWSSDMGSIKLIMFWYSCLSILHCNRMKLGSSSKNCSQSVLQE